MSKPSVPRSPSNASLKNISIPRSMIPTPLHEKKILRGRMTGFRGGCLEASFFEGLGSSAWHHPEPGHSFGTRLAYGPVKIAFRQTPCIDVLERKVPDRPTLLF